MSDTTNPLPDISHPVIDRYRRWDSVWWKFIKPLLETTRRTNELAENTEQTVNELSTTVGDNTTTITELQESVDGIHALWGVEINTNGRVVGAVKLDGTNHKSTFAVLADKFEIVHPTADGNVIQAFVAGLVNGVPTVGINGNLVVDDTIKANALDVNALSAISANIGTCTAGVLQSSDGKFVINLDSKYILITT
jgi:Domain of unknown function (DUF1983)